MQKLNDSFKNLIKKNLRSKLSFEVVFRFLPFVGGGVFDFSSTLIGGEVFEFSTIGGVGTLDGVTTALIYVKTYYIQR